MKNRFKSLLIPGRGAFPPENSALMEVKEQMSYQALYRAWRPDTFSEMVGQEAITRTLKHQVISGRIAHAYLFCGTRGTGKTTAAKVLSRAINCMHPVDGDPCGECEICKTLKQENCMDVIEIDAASNNGVDEIRDLREKIKYPPAVASYKVYIIDEVHMLSTGAFNALLKTLEEPPKHAVFILATTEPQKLPATILSRCQRFDFHRIPVETIIDRLMIVLGGIGRTASEDALYEIARAAEGGMRDALSLLDVCLSYTDGEVTAQLTRDVLGTAGRAFMFDFVDSLIEYNAGKALLQIDDMMRRGCDPQVFTRDTVAHLRAIMLAGAVKEGLAELMEITREDADRFIEQSKKISPDQLSRMMDLYMRAEPDMKWASRPRTMLELATVRACHPEDEADATVTERVDKLEKMIASGNFAAKPASPAAKQEPAVKPAAPASPAPKAKPVPAEKPPREYLDAVEKLGIENPSIRSPLGSMRFVRFDGQQVVVDFDKKQMMHMRMLERKKPMIEAALSEAFGAPVGIHMAVENDPSLQTKTVSQTAREVINQSYDIFGRENIDIVD